MKFLGYGFQKLEHREERQTGTHTDKQERINYHGSIQRWQA